MITVKELLQLPVTKNFSVAAGGNGMNKTIQSVEILDFEFVEGIEQKRETIFNAHSLVLSSLLFANQKPHILTDTIRKLIEMGVTALAYKPVIYQELPNEVLNLADAHHFPILSFGGDEFFEDVIFDVMEQMKERKHSLFLETIMKSLIEEEVSEEQLLSFLQQMNQPFANYVLIANVQVNQPNDSHWMKSFLPLDSFLPTGLVCPYKQSLFVLYTDNSQHQLNSLLRDWMKSHMRTSEAITIGYSQIHQTKKELHLAVREAYYACVMARLELSPTCSYGQLASERLLIELYRKDPTFAHRYAESYLAPVLVEPELLNTAVTFVQKKGNVKEIAAAHFCHPNTIRYRMTKVRELIEPLSNEFLFYEHLSAAVKIHLLHQLIQEPTGVLE